MLPRSSKIKVASLQNASKLGVDIVESPTHVIGGFDWTIGVYRGDPDEEGGQPKHFEVTWGGVWAIIERKPLD